MASKKKSAPASKSIEAHAEVPTRELKAFYHGQPTDEFTCARFYWPAGEVPRESIVHHFWRKRHPAGAESVVDTAAKVEVLLRGEIGEDYTDPDFLVRSFEEKLPLEETAAFAQVTMRFANATNLHSPWHRATSWLRSHYVDPLGVPVVAILHAPHLAGSDSPVHVHGLVLMRALSPFGWLGVKREIASDAGFRTAEGSWNAYKSAEAARVKS
jgi:hypothetical protein